MFALRSDYRQLGRYLAVNCSRDRQRMGSALKIFGFRHASGFVQTPLSPVVLFASHQIAGYQIGRWRGPWPVRCFTRLGAKKPSGSGFQLTIAIGCWIGICQRDEGQPQIPFGKAQGRLSAPFATLRSLLMSGADWGPSFPTLGAKSRTRRGWGTRTFWASRQGFISRCNSPRRVKLLRMTARMGHPDFMVGWRVGRRQGGGRRGCGWGGGAPTKPWSRRRG